MFRSEISHLSNQILKWLLFFFSSYGLWELDQVMKYEGRFSACLDEPRYPAVRTDILQVNSHYATPK